MSARAITEYDGKRLLSIHLNSLTQGKLAPPHMAQVKFVKDDNSTTNKCLEHQFKHLENQHQWLTSLPLVCKPDQVLKRRGKNNLILLNSTWSQVKLWIAEKISGPITIDSIQGSLDTFLIEPFIEHDPSTEEYYLSIQGCPEGDEVLFVRNGGVDVGDVDEVATRITIPSLSSGKIGPQNLEILFGALEKSSLLGEFLENLFEVYKKLHFTMLEINPIAIIGDDNYLHVLDLAAKLDQTAEYECHSLWSFGESFVSEDFDPSGKVTFPAPFGRTSSEEERMIEDLDTKTGASLKLTILNPNGRIWTMVAGGGASVAYADAISSLGFSKELANYGEYSGAPNTEQTYLYSRTILTLLLRSKPTSGGKKILFIGGGIANFTNVATTFKGIQRSITEFALPLKEDGVEIWVRRGGPNYQEGLRAMRALGDSLSLPIKVFGPETFITAIVPMALLDGYGSCDYNVSDTGNNPTPTLTTPSSTSTSSLSLPSSLAMNPVDTAGFEGFEGNDDGCVDGDSGYSGAKEPPSPTLINNSNFCFTKNTRCFVYGMQQRAVQGMLDFDYACKRKEPSVHSIIYPFGGDHSMKFYWGTKEILLPVKTSVTKAILSQGGQGVQVLVSFASHRSVSESVLEVLEKNEEIRCVAIIAEGVPERYSKIIRQRAKEKGVMIIGPATVGGIRAGCFRIGNTGGMMDNVLSSKLYRPGSVSYVSKSGGMSNELNNIISRRTNGVLEGIAIGGDRYPGSTFLDHIVRFEKDPLCQMIVLLGEVGGDEELKVVEAVSNGLIKKPVVAWCIGTCASMFGSEVQFGHAGALAARLRETALFKNEAMLKGGLLVPETFEGLPDLIESSYIKVLEEGLIKQRSEPECPTIPIDYAWAQELGLIRKPAQFVSSICDDRGQELSYSGMGISSIFKEDIGIGGVLSLLWFKRRLPDWGCKFIEMVLMLTADHGPAVSGAHNTIVAARAGKDLVSSLASGMLTIGERFGGALDGAAEQFTTAFDGGLSPQAFVDAMRKDHRLIMGIGHRVKSISNPDKRVTILKEFATSAFPMTPLLDYATKVELITTKKKDNLILNVDGCIAVLFVDLLRHSGAFTRDEADEYVKIGALNGLFVLGRSIGFIGHFIDQKRLKQGLYRHPWDDISYINSDALNSSKRYEN